MNMRLLKTQKVVLLIAGTLLIGVGSFILLSPATFYSANDIYPGANVSLLNELKAPAGMLLVAGLFIVAAAFMRGLSDTAMWLAALVYLSYAGSRILSMSFDGVPAEGLVKAAALESVLGLVCLVVVLMRRASIAKVA